MAQINIRLVVTSTTKAVTFASKNRSTDFDQPHLYQKRDMIVNTKPL
jgi:hypothetical protein